MPCLVFALCESVSAAEESAGTVSRVYIGAKVEHSSAEQPPRDEDGLRIVGIPADVRFWVSVQPESKLKKKYLWTFGGQSTSTEKSPVHRFKAAGTYAVAVVVSEEKGSTYKQSLRVEIAKEVCRSEDSTQCFKVVDQDPRQIAPDRMLVVDPGVVLSSKDYFVNMFLTEPSHHNSDVEHVAIDVSKYGKVDGGKVLVDIPALLGTLKEPLRSYDLSVRLSGADSEDIKGVIKGFAIAGGRLAIKVDSDITEAIIRHGGTGQEIVKKPNSSEVTFEGLPAGLYRVLLSGASGVAYGNAAVFFATPAVLVGSLQKTLPLAIENSLREERQIEKDAKLDSAPLKPLAEKFIGPLEQEIPLVWFSSDGHLFPDLRKGVVSSSMGAVNPGTGAQGRLSIQTDFSSIKSRLRPLIKPGARLEIQCEAQIYRQDSDWTSSVLPLLYGFDGATEEFQSYQTAKMQQAENEKVVETKKRFYEQKEFECKDLKQRSKSDASRKKCDGDLEKLGIEYRDYVQLRLNPARQKAEYHLARFNETAWGKTKNGVELVRNLRLEQATTPVAYRLFALTLTKRNGANTIRQIPIGNFQIEGYPLTRHEKKTMEFQIPSDIDPGAPILFEIQFSELGPRLFRDDPREKDAVWYRPRHQADCVLVGPR